MKPTLLPACAALLLATCAPTINISTPEPVVFDVNMKVEIETKDGSKDKTAVDTDTPDQRRRYRMAEVQKLKDNRIIGEGKDGLLYQREKPAEAAYAAYAATLVESENKDRLETYANTAANDSLKRPASYWAEEAAKRYRDGAWPGEWIQNPDGTWVQR
jgi:uncharacterized protein YdbL (DUF1318 family)